MLNTSYSKKDNFFRFVGFLLLIFGTFFALFNLFSYLYEVHVLDNDRENVKYLFFYAFQGSVIFSCGASIKNIATNTPIFF